jgi:hypothetical protein
MSKTKIKFEWGIRWNGSPTDFSRCSGEEEARRMTKTYEESKGEHQFVPNIVTREIITITTDWADLHE